MNKQQTDAILAQIEDAQSTHVLDDTAIWQMPFLVVAQPGDSDEVELVSRHTTEAEAITASDALKAEHGTAYDDVEVTTLAAVGYPAVVDHASLDTPEHTDEGGTPTLIDPAAYESEELALPKVDGNAITRIALAFTGEIYLDRSDPNDVRLYRDLLLGKGGLTLKVNAKCSGTGAKLATDKGGELDVVVGRKTLRIESIDVPAGA